MTTRAFIRDLLGYRWAAVVRDGSPVAVYLDLPHAPSLLGDIWLGRVTRIEASLDAAFVELGDGGAGFLRGKDASGTGVRQPIGKSVHEGQLLQLEVIRDAEPGDGKGPHLSARPTNEEVAPDPDVTGKPRIVMARSDALSRLLRDWPDGALDEIATDSRQVAARASAAGLSIRSNVGAKPEDREAIHDAVAEAVDHADSNDWKSPTGVSLRFDKTRALTVIDVDGGGSSRDALTVNLEAAREVPRLLRLKQIGGLCVVDFITLGDRDGRKRVANALRSAAGDETDIGAMSARGLLELARRKTGPSISDRLNTDCLTCGTRHMRCHPAVTALLALGSLEVEALANPSGRPVLSAPKCVIDAVDKWLAPAVQRLTDVVGRQPEMLLDLNLDDDGASITWKS